MFDVLTGILFGTLTGVGVWWIIRIYMNHYGSPIPVPTALTPAVDAYPAPAGVPATNPLSPAGGGEGVLSPRVEPDDAPVLPSTASNQTPTGLWSPQTLVMCLTLAAWGAFVGWRASALPIAIGALLVTGLLLTISVVDLAARRIPNPLVLALLGWALVQSLWLGQPTLANLVIGLLAAGGFFLLLALLTPGALGLGDVKLAAAIGALVGWPAMVAALFLGIVAGGIAALLLLLTHRASRKDPFAYGPYLALGGWLVYCFAVLPTLHSPLPHP